MTTVPERNVYARELVWRMYRDAGDEDYLVARWASKNGLWFQFYWNSLQAIEKYLKGALLLNDVSVKDFGHNIVQLYERLRPIGSELLPDLICKPNYFPRVMHFSRGFPEPIQGFIERVSEEGDTSNRYRHYTLIYYADDLHKLDETCFRLRRLVTPLDLDNGDGFGSNRSYLLRNWNSQFHSNFSFTSRLEKLKSNGNDELDKALRWRNFSYFEQDALADGKICSEIATANSQLIMTLEHGDEGLEAVSWLIKNAFFSKSDGSALQRLIADRTKFQE